MNVCPVLNVLVSQRIPRISNLKSSAKSVGARFFVTLYISIAISGNLRFCNVGSPDLLVVSGKMQT